MLTNKEKRLLKDLRAMVAVITIVLLVALVGHQEKEVMLMDSNTPSVMEIAYMESIGYEYEVTEEGIGYFVKEVK